MDLDDSKFDFDFEANNKSYLSSRSTNGIKYRKTKSACEKSFDSLINKNCSWSYKTFNENESINSSPQGFSATTSYIPSNKKHQNGTSTNMNGIKKENDNEIKQNTDSALIIPSSSESIFDSLSFENKMSSLDKTKNDNSIKHTSPKRRSLRTSKPINYAIDINSESSSDGEMVLQTRIFKNTKNVDSNNYKSNHNSNSNNGVFNQTTPNIPSEVLELKNSLPKNNVLDEGINASENSNSGSCLDMSTNESDSEENLYSKKIKINDTVHITDETKKNQGNRGDGNKSERKNLNFTEADEISIIKETRRKDHVSRINNPQFKRKLESSKSTTSAKEIKNYELTVDDLVYKPYISNGENSEKHYSDSNRSSCPSFPNLLNSDEEMGEVSPNIDDFSDESEQDVIIMSSYLGKDESKNLELEQDEINPQDTEMSEYVSPSPIPERYYTRKQVSDKYKDVKNTDLQHEINKISLSVCSEVESIGNKTELSGSISEDEKITFDFLDGSLDLGKYKSTRHDVSSTREKQNGPIQKRKQIREENPEPIKRSNKKQPVIKAKVQTLKEKTQSRLKNGLRKTKNLYKHKNTEKQSTLNPIKTTEKTKQASEHITLQSNFSKRNKTVHEMYAETSPVNNHTQIATNKTARNLNSQFPKQKPPRKKDITLGISKNKNSKETEDLLFIESNEYNIPSLDNSLNEILKENTQHDVQIEKPVKSHSRDFEDYTCLQNNYLSTSRNIPTREKNITRSRKSTKKISKFDCNKNVSTKESCKNNGIEEIYILSSGKEEDNAENEIKPSAPKNKTKKKIQTWDDLETLLITNDADKAENEASLTNAIENSTEENFEAWGNTKIFSYTNKHGKDKTSGRTSLNKGRRNASKRKIDSQSFDNSPVQNIPNRSSTLDIIKTIPNRYSFNRHFKKLTFPEKNLENENQITLSVKNSPSMSIIDKTIAKMNNCATLCLKTGSEAPQLDKTESSDESNKDESPVLTEFSYAIQEFKSTMYFTANNRVSSTKETCFASKRAEKGAMQENNAIFSTQNFKRHMQNKSGNAVINSKEILPISHSVSLKPISTRLTTSSPTREMNKDVTSVRRKQKILSTPDLKIASDSLTIKSNKNVLMREEKVEIEHERKVLNKKPTLNELDSFVSEMEDTSTSLDNIDFNITGQIDEQKNYNLRKRKCHNYKEETVDNQEIIIKQKRESNRSNQQLYNSTDDSNLKIKEILFLNDHLTEQEPEKSLNNAVEQRETKSNTELKKQFLSGHSNSERKQIYSDSILNKSSNLIESKQNDHRADKSDMSSIKNVSDIMSDTNEKSEDSLIPKEVITFSYKIPSNKSNTEKNPISAFVEETENGSSKPLKENTHLALSSSKQEKKQTYDKYKRYLKELSQQESSSSEASENNEYSPPQSFKTKTRQKYPKPVNKGVNGMAETSDDDVFSISSFDTDSDGNEVSHTQGTGFLFDVLKE